MEKYSAVSAVRGAMLGVLSAIMAVNLLQEKNPEAPSYEASGKATLDKLSDGGSDVYMAMPGLRKNLTEIAGKANGLFPSPDAMPYLQDLLLMMMFA